MLNIFSIQNDLEELDCIKLHSYLHFNEQLVKWLQRLCRYAAGRTGFSDLGCIFSNCFPGVRFCKAGGSFPDDFTEQEGWLSMMAFQPQVTLEQYKSFEYLKN